MKTTNRFCYFTLAVFLVILDFRISFAEAVPPRLYSVEVSATVQTTPPKIQLQWPADANASSYSISRKTLDAAAWTPLASLPGSATSYTDSNVSVGSSFEYQILKTTAREYSGSGYIYSGISAPPIENRGKVILLVDSTFSTPLAAELKRLQQDLAGDGWIVLRQDVSRTAPVPAIKSIIQNLYATDPGQVKALLLFGHIPVPYSGDFDADSHENHTGAWPTDIYYADVDGVWTDSTVNDVTAEKAWNHNVPGDGKFDQSVMPSDVELQVGRVDLYYMTCFSNKTPSRDEEMLLRQYLNKDHNFRNGLLQVPRRGIICDNFEPDSEALASTGWRNFAPLFGASNNVQVPGGSFFSTLSSQGYLFAYGTGGGSWYTCNGIGSSDDFALQDMKAVFTFFFGSYFGDWDNESNFLRAPLGSTTYTLTSAWGGRPHWFVHHMGLGETIGFATRLTQNNGPGGLYLPRIVGNREVHTTLLGDPTLRLHPVIPPGTPTATQGSGVTLSWTASTDSNLQGYYVYRASSEAGPFARISGTSPVLGTTFTDANGTSASVYMIRALKLETSASGTYYNLSQGVFARAQNLATAPRNLTATYSSGQVALTWSDTGSATGFNVYRKSGTEPSFTRIGQTSAGIFGFEDTAVTVGSSYTYAVTALNAAGESDFSNTASLTIPGEVTGTFVGFDTTSGGSWRGVYGREGFNVIEDLAGYPAYVNVAASGNSSWVWNWTDSDPAALQRASDNTRVAACWYAPSQFDVQLWFTDGAAHRVAFYFLDWDMAGRKQTVQIIRSADGAILSTQTLQSFQNGVYAIYDLQGRVTVRVHALSGNAVLSGLFFDSSLPAVATPTINPAGTTFTNAVTVSISTTTPGATIRYTKDGSNPTASSTIYSSPLSLTNTATIKARAFKSGMADSSISSATYTRYVPAGPPSATVTFNGTNTTRGGTWKGVVGSQGVLIPTDAQRLPGYATVTPAGNSEWVWEYSTTDARALQRDTATSRVASCWYASGSFDVALSFKDALPHRVTFYCLDWDAGGRRQIVEIIDAASKQVLHSLSVRDFVTGIYLDYTFKGNVIVRFTHVTSYNAVVNGIFFDAP